MKISIVDPRELGESQINNWISLQHSEPLLASPYFSPYFTIAAAECISDVFVAILEDDGREIGYFPYQHKSKFIGGPVGGMLSDYQAVIVKKDVEWDVISLIKQCGLSVWDFDHLLLSQEPFKPFYHKLSFSPIMDISKGFEAYCKEQKESGVKRIEQFLRKSRKIERELDNLTIEINDTDPCVLTQVFSWKLEQCRRTGVVEFFNYKWARELVERIFTIREPVFSGLLSTIKQDEKIIAAHMGMRTPNVLHYWFPTYNHDYAKYSPGGVLLLHLAKELSKDHIDYIDLGKGDDIYKASFANGQIELAEGSVMVPSIRAAGVKYKRNTVSTMKKSVLLKPARQIYKYVRDKLKH